MKVLLTGWLGAGSTEIAQIIAKDLGMEVINSYKAIRDLVRERGESFELFESESRSGEYDIDVLLRNKALEYLEEERDLIVEGRIALLVLDREYDLKAFLTARTEDRVEHVAERRNVAKSKAQKIVEMSDRDRRSVVEKLLEYPLELNRFDIILNTSSYGFARAAATLIELLKEHRP